jgi:hypothetical protein
MFTPDSVSIWLKEQAWPIAIILLLAVAVFILLKLSVIHRRAVLSRQREGDTEQTFVENLARYNFDPLITATTYRYLQQVQRIRFPILPSDALDEDLGLDCEDVNQTVRELLVALKREEAPGLRHEPMMTVEDLVRHLQASPRKRQQSAA